MSAYLLTVNSCDRNVDKWPNSQDYLVNLNRPLYDVSELKLANAIIPFSGYTIDTHNNTFYYNDEEITMTPKIYTSEATLATDISAAIASDTANTVAVAVAYESGTNTYTFDGGSTAFDLVFGTNSPASVFGFVPGTYSSSSFKIISSGVDISGTQFLYMSILPNNRDHLKSEIYTQDPGYVGTILRRGNPTHIDMDEAVQYKFPRGKEPVIKSLRVQFWVDNFGVLSPYDFKLQNHTLKFEITCNLDKLNVEPVVRKSFELPQALKLHEFAPKYNKNVMVYGGATVILCLIVMVLTSFKTVSLKKRT